MPPRLRVLAGTGTTLTPITHLVNTTHAFPLLSDRFEGEVVVCIKGLNHPDKEVYKYFELPERQGITWSVQVRGTFTRSQNLKLDKSQLSPGRFLDPVSADDVLFGNTFDRALGLPWGSGAALKFMNYIDPTLEHDLTSQTHPWALSPLVATMPHFAHTRVDSLNIDEYDHNHLSPPSDLHRSISTTKAPSKSSPFPPTVSLVDDTSQLHLARRDRDSSSSSGGSAYGSAYGSTSSLSSTLSASGASSYLGVSSGSPRAARAISSIKEKVKGRGRKKKEKAGLGLGDAAQRRAYFASAAHRQDIVFGPEDVLTMDFCYGFLEFSPSLTLRLPGGLSFDLMRYWDGQPVRFVCCERKTGPVDDGLPWGEVFWSVVIETEEVDPDVENCH
ncbi:hypothetical protein DXG01_004498 [Tephrocybe rancida]|nr:hypothetical protein DXG01_004498 [Tephrocybe rancida]